ncbi:MAG: hypothetical protein WC100_04625 [Sterolibacterium sp.]
MDTNQRTDFSFYTPAAAETFIPSSGRFVAGMDDATAAGRRLLRAEAAKPGRTSAGNATPAGIDARFDADFRRVFSSP